MDFGIPWLGDATIPVADTTTNSRMATVFFATFRKLCHVRRKMSFVGGKFGITFFWLLCRLFSFVQVFLFSKRELSNGSIFHKRHKTLFNREDYEIYHFQVGESSRGYFDRVYKVCSTESLINVSIIQGAKKHRLSLFLGPTLFDSVNLTQSI